MTSDPAEALAVLRDWLAAMEDPSPTTWTEYKRRSDELMERAHALVDGAAAPAENVETREEWGCRWVAPDRTFYRRFETEEYARDCEEEWPERATVVRRTVTTYTGPWVEVPR